MALNYELQWLGGETRNQPKGLITVPSLFKFQKETPSGVEMQQLMTIARLVSLLLRVGCRENGIELRTIVAWQVNQKQTQEVAAAIMLLLLRRRAIYFCIAEDLYNYSSSSQLVVKSRECSNQHAYSANKPKGLITVPKPLQKHSTALLLVQLQLPSQRFNQASQIIGDRSLLRVGVP